MWHVLFLLLVLQVISFTDGLAYGSAPTLQGSQSLKYEPNWESLDKRPTPSWFDDAKFGIFIHWGLYSVPAWAPTGQVYAEWYESWLPSPQQPDPASSPVLDFHRRAYGPNFTYADFVPMFRAELFDPTKWAELIKAAGAKYVVLTSKHHDGFALWQSPQAWDWNAADVGPHRHIAAELGAAVRAAGLHWGLYYSLMEFQNPLLRGLPGVMEPDMQAYVDTHMLPQLRDIVHQFRPDVLWADGNWEFPSEAWKSQDFLAWLFNESPVRGSVVVNDRWGSDTPGKHGGIFTPEYSAEVYLDHKWEENSGIDQHSYGYNRDTPAGGYLPASYLVRLLARSVALGGNLLLNLGPSADGRIPEIMQERLLEIGAWLDVNGAAIYNTSMWRVHSEDGGTHTYPFRHAGRRLQPDSAGPCRGELGRGRPCSDGVQAKGMAFARVYYTQAKARGDSSAEASSRVYAIVTSYPAIGEPSASCRPDGRCAVLLKSVKPNPTAIGTAPSAAAISQDGEGGPTEVRLLGYAPAQEDLRKLEWEAAEGGGGLRVWVPALGAAGMERVRSWGFVLQLSNVA